jgi:hypothetical protein
MVTNQKINHKTLMTILTLILTTGNAAAVTHKFGTEPYNDVIAAANNATTKCTNRGLTSTKLAVMLLAASWRETVDASPTTNATRTPSPMMLGRYDFGSLLYSTSTSTAAPRAFAHGGIGLWQLDDAIQGLGAGYIAAERINTKTSSEVAANAMSKEYCRSTSATEAGRRVLAWKQWYACDTSKKIKGGARCEALYQQHYNAIQGNIQEVVLDNSVTRLGGMLTRDCALSSDKMGFQCFYINPSLAEGYTGFFLSTPGGSATISPLALPFYNYRFRDGHEYRHWLKDDTGYTSEISVRRPIGQDSRVANTWKKDNVLCRGIELSPFPFTPLGGTCNFL